MRSLLLVLALVLPGLVIAACCCRPTGPFSSSRPSVPVESQVAEQNELHEGLRAFPSAYRNAPNEIKKSDIFRQANDWKARYGQRINFTCKNWEGVISNISTTQGGGMASVSIRSDARGFRIYYKSGMQFKKGTALYKVLESMTEGQKVAFSGAFKVDKQRGMKEMSFTEHGSLDEPEFFVQFTEIRPRQ